MLGQGRLSKEPVAPLRETPAVWWLGRKVDATQISEVLVVVLCNVGIASARCLHRHSGDRELYHLSSNGRIDMARSLFRSHHGAEAAMAAASGSFVCTSAAGAASVNNEPTSVWKGGKVGVCCVKGSGE
jgi:hypothetical protein